VNHKYRKLNVGLLGIGLDTYWGQFEGLQERLHSYLSVVQDRIQGEQRSIVNYGLVDTPQKSVDVGHRCRRDDVDVLLVYLTTYALSSTLLPLLQRAKVPVLMLNLQPEPTLHYKAVNGMSSRGDMTGEWLAYCNSCPVPEISNVLRRLDMSFDVVTGVLNDDKECWSKIDNWLQAAEVLKVLAHCRMGLMGGYYSGMLDIATDLTQLCGTFGIHIEQLEADELSNLRDGVTQEELVEKRKAFSEFFEIEPDCSGDELVRAARTAVALDRFVSCHDLDLMAYYHKGRGNHANEDTMSSIILGTSMLTGRNIPVAGEYEVKNVVAMKILDALGAGGSFSEYYAIDFTEDVILLGHDGPGHIGIAQDRIKVRPLQVYHGKVGKGLSVEMSVRYGPVTLLSVAEDSMHRFKFVVAEGESVPGEILEIGNTNSRYRFSIGARAFVNSWSAQGPAHHCAIGVGHIAEKLKCLASLLQIPIVQIC
jgi:L-arabinose isomerase